MAKPRTRRGSPRRAASAEGSRRLRSTSTRSNGAPRDPPPRRAVPAPGARSGPYGRQVPSRQRSGPWSRGCARPDRRPAGWRRRSRRPPGRCRLGGSKASSRRKLRALPCAAGDDDRAAHSAWRQALRDHQAQAAAAEQARRIGVGLREGREQPAQRRRRDAGAGILDLDRQTPTRPRAPQPGRPAASHGPPSVNLSALPIRLSSTWRRRPGSTRAEPGAPGRSSQRNSIRRCAWRGLDLQPQPVEEGGGSRRRPAPAPAGPRRSG